MGIFGFSSLLKKCPTAVGYDLLSILSNKKIAIDFLGFWHSNWAVCHRLEVNNINILTDVVDPDKIFERFKDLFKSQMNKLLKLSITPIFVLDGVASEEKEKHTKTKRRDDKQKKISNIEFLQNQIKIDGPIKGRQLIDKLKTAILNSPRFSYKHSLVFVELIKDLGFPFLKAKGLTGEADKLLAYLCQKGYVQGVFSKDRDLLAFGAPYLITGFAGYKQNQYTNKKELHIETIVLETILKNLNITYTQFVDVCILAGCDYNEKTPRKGIITVYNLIKTYGNIENIPKTKMNIQKQNYETARKFFLTEETYEDLCEIPNYNLDIDFNVLKDLEERLVKYKMYEWSETVRNCYNEMSKHRIVTIKTNTGIIRLKIKNTNKIPLLDQKQTDLAKKMINKVEHSDFLDSLLL